MTVKRYAGDKFTGLSGDTKPASVVEGATFYELDTGKQFNFYSGSWSEISYTDYTDAEAVAAIKADPDWNAGNWDIAFGWGNHASAGYAVLGTGTGEVRSNSQLDGRYGRLDSDNIWLKGNQFDTDALDLMGKFGFATTFTTLVDVSDKTITFPNETGTVALVENLNISNWDEAYGWGNFQDYGLGSNISANSDDFNNTVVTQFEWKLNSVTNSPSNNAGSLINVRRGTGIASQIFIEQGSDRFWFRRETGGGWQTWRELHHTGVFEYSEDTVTLGGDFDAGSQVKCVRIGSQVTITGVGNALGHSSQSQADSLDGAIPSQYRPNVASAGIVTNCYYSLNRHITAIVSGSGRFSLGHVDFDGSSGLETGSAGPPTITYSV